jgi:hypothetical protein
VTTPLMTIPVDFQSSWPVWKNFSLVLSCSSADSGIKKVAYVKVTSEKIYKLFVPFGLLLDEVLELGGSGGEVPSISML